MGAQNRIGEVLWAPPQTPMCSLGPITSVCFSKDGQCTLAASLDSTLRLLDKDTGELLGEYEPPARGEGGRSFGDPPLPPVSPP